ncbi:MAG: nuclear transport factor 2 family protein [Shinella sp.]|uniref:nuclear transport factor 2 family protein n=1 Tax=Shinella sp. TaxID=1870904 RepID=UPI00403604D4
MKTVNVVDGAAIKQAIEGRDGKLLPTFYADDAVVRVIDRDNPPSKPREVRGQQAISEYFADVCGRDMIHKVDIILTEGDRLAFTQNCMYPDGARVFCAAFIEFGGSRIVRQTIVQAWDG